MIVDIAATTAQARGQPFKHWSLRKQQLSISKKLDSLVSHTAIARVLQKANVSFQRTRRHEPRSGLRIRPTTLKKTHSLSLLQESAQRVLCRPLRRVRAHPYVKPQSGRS